MERRQNKIIEYEIDPKYRVFIKSASKGMQEKYLKDGYWYKTNAGGYQGLAEYMASLFLKHFNLKITRIPSLQQT